MKKKNQKRNDALKQKSAVENELMKKKLLKIYYPEEVRNKIFEWAKTNGYNTSTYLGQPMVKYAKLFILLDRAT